MAAISALADPLPPGTILLHELKINPPGEDAPYEFIELRGEPGLVRDNLYLLLIEGDGNDDPGVLDARIDLSGVPLGANGFLLVAGEDHPYAVPPETTVLTHVVFSVGGAGLENGAASILLAICPIPPPVGLDLDRGDNGTLEQLPFGTVVLDAIGWAAGRRTDIVFGGAELTPPDGIPDAAGRFPGRHAPIDASAWFCGELADGPGEQLLYAEPPDGAFPAGTMLTPGGHNLLAPVIDFPSALSGVIGDPTNPGVVITVDATDAAPGPVDVTATSDTPEVVPDENLHLTAIGTNRYLLSIDPVGVGYAEISIHAANTQATGIARLAYAASQPNRPGGTFLTGVSDGSAAVPIDADWMLVADDENQVIRLYPRHVSGPPVATFDLEPHLALTDYEAGVPREVDFEGVTRDGDMVYWLGSHSHAEIGELRPNRWRVVATQLTGSGPTAELAYVGHYECLRDDLLAWDASNAHGLGADSYQLAASAADGIIPKEPHGAGFNLEGLTMVPGQPDAAYLCFRAPLVPVTHRARSLVVPVTNLAAMAVGGDIPGQALFGKPIELFFGGRAIRGIEGGPDGFLITAGPVDNRDALSPHVYKLYSWSGLPHDPPRERSADLTFLNPECIVELPPAPWTPADKVQVISDTGRTIYYNDGVAAKLLPEPAFKKFRSDWIEIGHVVDAAPVIRSFSYAEPGGHLAWFAQTGRTYRVESTPTLPSPTWTRLGEEVTADVPLLEWPVAPLPASPVSLRVLLLPPDGP